MCVPSHRLSWASLAHRNTHTRGSRQRAAAQTAPFQSPWRDDSAAAAFASCFVLFVLITVIVVIVSLVRLNVLKNSNFARADAVALMR